MPSASHSARKEPFAAGRKPRYFNMTFRNSIRGYNKKDVNEYIASVDAKHAEDIADASAKTDELRAELEAAKNLSEIKLSGLEASLRASAATIKTYEKKTSELGQALSTAQSDAEKAKNDAERFKRRCADAEAKLAKQADEIIRLKAAVLSAATQSPTDEELAELRRKAVLYDELEAKHPAIPQSGAAAEADNVIQSAHVEAESIRTEALRNNAESIEAAKKQVNDELAEIYELIRRAANEELDGILTRIRSASAEVIKLQEQFSDQNRDAAERLESMRNELEGEIEKKLNETRERTRAAHEAKDSSEASKKVALASSQRTVVDKAVNNDDTRKSAHRAASNERERIGRAKETMFRFGRRK